MRYTLFVWSEMLPFSFFFRGGGGGISKLDILSIGAGSELDISITGSGIPFSDNPRSFPSERPASSRPGSAFPPTLVLRAGAWSSCSAMFTSGWALGVGAKAGSRCSLICISKLDISKPTVVLRAVAWSHSSAIFTSGWALEPPPVRVVRAEAWSHCSAILTSVCRK